METQFDKRVKKVVDPELHKVIALFQSSEHPNPESVDPEVVTTVKQGVRLAADIKTELEPLARKKKKEEEEEEDEEQDPSDDESQIEKVIDQIREEIKELLDWTQFGDRDDDGIKNYLDWDDNIEDLLKALDWTKRHIKTLVMTGQKLGVQVENARRDARNRVMLERIQDSILRTSGRQHNQLKHLYQDMLDKFALQQSQMSDGFYSVENGLTNLSDQLDQCCENQQLLIDDVNRRIEGVGDTLTNCCTNMGEKLDDIKTGVDSIKGFAGTSNRISGMLGILDGKLDKLGRYL